MKAIIIGGNENVSEAIREQLVEYFNAKAHLYNPEGDLKEEDQVFLQSADIVLIDLTSKFVNSRLFVKEVKELSPEARIIVLHIYREQELITPLFHAGAAAYVLIDTIPDHLPLVVKRVLGGEENLSAGIE
ncbi:MAG: hypothetical protein ACLFPE_04315 [Bacteroidales bacterium]